VQGQLARSCDWRNESSGSIKYEEFD
jgi:hypothetical protein